MKRDEKKSRLEVQTRDCEGEGQWNRKAGETQVVMFRLGSNYAAEW